MFLLGSRKNDKSRAFELDFLRGVAIVMMIIMHATYDVRYEFKLDVFSYLHSPFFWEFFHPIIVGLFVTVSGICCTFSRNNIKRGVKLLGIAMCFTVATYIATNYLGIYCLIIFNVLHLLSVSTILYGLLSIIEKKLQMNPKAMTLIIGFIGIYIMLLNNNLYRFAGQSSSIFLMIVGVDTIDTPLVVDDMPLIPWVGVFLIGAAIGRMCYENRKTLWENAGSTTRKITAPFEFLGRHSLLIYLVHQPIVYGLLYVFLHLTGVVD